MTYKNTALLKHARSLSQLTKVRFILVGISNTLVDFAVFNIIFVLLLSSDKDYLVASNVIAATVAMIYSYFMNKRTVFRDKDSQKPRQILLFLLVTLSGIWIIQNILMVSADRFLEAQFSPQNEMLLLFLANVAKAFGTLGSAAWNYFGYSRLVFANAKQRKLSPRA